MTELRRVPINAKTMKLVSNVLTMWSSAFDKHLTLAKNAEYGDAWQAEGPFLAASRMKDKIARVETVMETHSKGIRNVAALTTNAEGFQDILEMMQYGKMLMLYWVHNHMGLAGTEAPGVNNAYDNLEIQLERLLANESRGKLDQNPGGNSPAE